MQDLEWSQD